MEAVNKLPDSLKLRMLLLRKAKYRCAVCQGVNHKEGYYSPSGQFIECDAHMRDWALRQGQKLIRVSLQIILQIPGCLLVKGQKYLVLCRKHSMEYKNEVRLHKSALSKNTGA